MQLFSFKKKKQATLDAKESKRKERLEKHREREEFHDEQQVGAAKKKKEVRTKVVGTLPASLANVLVRPRITEKGTDLASDHNAYVFDVDPSATKPEIAKAVQALYKVTPTKVRIVKVASKKIISRGKQGVRSGGKKAYVFLKEGDSIEFV